MGRGNSSRSSHSWAAGRTTSAAKVWTHSWIWSWSSFSDRENSDMGPKLPGSNLRMHTTGDPRGEGDGDHGEDGAGRERRPGAHVAEQRGSHDRPDHPGERRCGLLEPERRAAPILVRTTGDERSERRRQQTLAGGDEDKGGCEHDPVVGI